MPQKESPSTVFYAARANRHRCCSLAHSHSLTRHCPSYPSTNKRTDSILPCFALHVQAPLSTCRSYHYNTLLLHIVSYLILPYNARDSDVFIIIRNLHRSCLSRFLLQILSYFLAFPLSLCALSSFLFLYTSNILLLPIKLNLIN